MMTIHLSFTERTVCVGITEMGGWAAFLELPPSMDNELLYVSSSLSSPSSFLHSHPLLSFPIFFSQYHDSKISLDRGELESTG